MAVSEAAKAHLAQLATAPKAKAKPVKKPRKSQDKEAPCLNINPVDK